MIRMTREFRRISQHTGREERRARQEHVGPQHRLCARPLRSALRPGPFLTFPARGAQQGAAGAGGPAAGAPGVRVGRALRTDAETSWERSHPPAHSRTTLFCAAHALASAGCLVFLATGGRVAPLGRAQPFIPWGAASRWLRCSDFWQVPGRLAVTVLSQGSTGGGRADRAHHTARSSTAVVCGRARWGWWCRGTCCLCFAPPASRKACFLTPWYD